MKNNIDNYLGVYDYFELTNEKVNITMNRFLLTLDWLFMMGKIKFDCNKGLILCI